MEARRAELAQLEAKVERYERSKATYETLVGVVTNEWNSARDAIDALARKTGATSTTKTTAPDGVFIDPFIARLISLAGEDASALDAASGKRKRGEDASATAGAADELEDDGLEDSERDALVKALREKADDTKGKLAAVLDAIESKTGGQGDTELSKKMDALEASRLKLRRDYDALQHAYLRDSKKCKDLTAELDDMHVELAATRRRLAIAKASGGDDTIEGLPKMATAEDARAAGAEAQAKAAAAAEGKSNAGGVSRPDTPVGGQPAVAAAMSAAEVAKYAGTIAELEGKLKHNEKTIAELNKEKTDLALQVRTLGDAQNFEASVQKSSAYVALSNRTQSLRDENERLANELRDARRTLDRAHQDSIRDRQAAERGEAAITRLRSAEARANELDSRLSHVVKSRDDLEFKVRALTEKADMNVSTDEKLKQLDIVMQENKVLKDENTRLMASYKSFEEAKIQRDAADAKVKSLEASVADLEGKVAKKSSAKQADLEKQIALLKEQLAGAEATATSAQSALEEKQGEVMMYVEECEAISGAYAEAQEQSTRLLKRIATSEEGQNKAVGERIAAQAHARKFEDECARVSETAAYYKRDLDNAHARTAELEGQLAEATTVLAKMREETSGTDEQVERSKTQLRAMEKQIVDVREQLQASEQKVADLLKRSKKELGELEAAKQAKTKAESQVAGLKKKCDRLMKEGGTKDLHEEVAAYKTMMNCSVCMERPKSVIITRCYHMFCKTCIDKTVEARQRKCPGCGSGFATGDVSAIYF